MPMLPLKTNFWKEKQKLLKSGWRVIRVLNIGIGMQYTFEKDNKRKVLRAGEYEMENEEKCLCSHEHAIRGICQTCGFDEN